jgi:hypothetical protein
MTQRSKSLLDKITKRLLQVGTQIMQLKFDMISSSGLRVILREKRFKLPKGQAE